MTHLQNNNPGGSHTPQSKSAIPNPPSGSFAKRSPLANVRGPDRAAISNLRRETAYEKMSGLGVDNCTSGLWHRYLVALKERWPSIPQSLSASGVSLVADQSVLPLLNSLFSGHFSKAFSSSLLTSAVWWGSFYALGPLFQKDFKKDAATELNGDVKPKNGRGESLFKAGFFMLTSEALWLSYLTMSRVVFSILGVSDSLAHTITQGVGTVIWLALLPAWRIAAESLGEKAYRAWGSTKG